MEIGDSFGLEQLWALAVSAKNNMHNIRGYSPNQWAFGQDYSRIPSFLENTNNLPHQAARSQPTFEEQVQAEYKARKLFLQVDAQKRNSKALHAKSRPLGNFAWGNWFTISERVPKEGSRYGGHWYGPARVLTHEKTGDFEEGQHWVLLSG